LEKEESMSTDRKTLEKIIGNALSGKGSHVEAKNLLAGLTWRAAGTRGKGAPHTIFQVVNHMIYWQDWVVKWLEGEDPQVPKHASGGWPGAPAPASAKEWRQVARRFRSGVAGLARRSRKTDPLAKRGKSSPLEMLQAIASHNSYHAGQIVVLRQMLGTWPPPSGGVTW